MKLYSVQVSYGSNPTPTLVVADVIKETPQFYFTQSTEVTRWSRRVPKGAVDRADGHGSLATTPKSAWERFQGFTRRQKEAAEAQVLKSVNHLQVAQIAIDAINQEAN